MDAAPQSKLGSGAGVGAVVLAAIVFSSGFVLVKGLPLPAATIAFWRLVIGAGALLVAALVLRVGPPVRWGAMIGAGLAFGVHQLLYILATQQTSIAIVTLVGGAQPLVLALVSARALGERFSGRLLLWSLVAVVGVAIVVWANLDDRSRSLSGDVLSVLNLIAVSVFFLFIKRARTDGVHTLTLTTGMLLGALVVVTPVLALSEQRLPATGTHWVVIAALALLPGNGHLLVNWALSRVSTTLASLTLAAVPLLASIWAHLAFGEPYGVEHVLGSLFVAAAVEGGRRAENARA